MKFTISHIVAMAENRVIGRDGGMPWHISEDFKFFKTTTMGHAMIMGRKTWDSIGRALPGRLSVIVTRNLDLKKPDGSIVVPSIEAAISFCKAHQSDWGNECFIIGGGELYRQSMPYVDRIYLTMIHRSVPGDTYYPMITSDRFQQVWSEPHLEASTPFSFQRWETTTAK